MEGYFFMFICKYVLTIFMCYNIPIVASRHGLGQSDPYWSNEFELCCLGLFWICLKE